MKILSDVDNFPLLISSVYPLITLIKHQNSIFEIYQLVFPYILRGDMHLLISDYKEMIRTVKYSVTIDWSLDRIFR